jgi:hypothetical protein
MAGIYGGIEMGRGDGEGASDAHLEEAEILARAMLFRVIGGAGFGKLKTGDMAGGRSNSRYF